MSNKDTLIRIEEKRQILTNMLAKNNIDLRNKEVLKISKELDVLITKYIHEVKNRVSK